MEENFYLADQKIKEIVSQYCHDYFFHYLLIHHDELRLYFCQYLLGNDKMVYTVVENAEVYGDVIGAKKNILDIVAKDDLNRYFNIEMQSYDMSEDDLVRFQNYGMKLITRQEKKGVAYHKIQDVYQLIIYAGRPIDGFHYYQHRVEQMDERYFVKLKEGRLHMNIVQLANMEEKEVETIPNKFNQLMYLFKTGKPYPKIEPDDLVKEVMHMHNQYLHSDEIIKAYELERERLYEKTKREMAFENGMEIGKEKGLKLGEEKGIKIGEERGKKIGEEKGMKKGLLLALKMQLNKRLGNISEEIVTQLYQCNEEQLQSLIMNMDEIHDEKDIMKILF